MLLEGFLTALAEVFIFPSSRRWKRTHLRDFRVGFFMRRTPELKKSRSSGVKRHKRRVRTALPQSGLIDVSRQWAGYQKGRISY